MVEFTVSDVFTVTKLALTKINLLLQHFTNHYGEKTTLNIEFYKIEQ